MTSSAAVSHSSACCRGAAVNRRRRDGQHTERLWPEYVEPEWRDLAARFGLGSPHMGVNVGFRMWLGYGGEV